LAVGVGACVAVHVLLPTVNLDATRAGSPAPAIGASALSGRIAWRTTASGEHWYSSAGGVVSLDPHGITVRDPSTGRERWHYERWDAPAPWEAFESRLWVSASGRWIAAMPYGDSPSPGTHSELLVFDAVTGRLAADRTVRLLGPGPVADPRPLRRHRPLAAPRRRGLRVRRIGRGRR
jgi:hypothetical protein